ncbi:hypothetical protein BD410DRAFT_810562, partial [Rickenella mellea]
FPTSIRTFCRQRVHFTTHAIPVWNHTFWAMRTAGRDTFRGGKPLCEAYHPAFASESSFSSRRFSRSSGLNADKCYNTDCHPRGEENCFRPVRVSTQYQDQDFTVANNFFTTYAIPELGSTCWAMRIAGRDRIPDGNSLFPQTSVTTRTAIPEDNYIVFDSSSPPDFHHPSRLPTNIKPSLRQPVLFTTYAILELGPHLLGHENRRTRHISWRESPLKYPTRRLHQRGHFRLALSPKTRAWTQTSVMTRTAIPGENYTVSDPYVVLVLLQWVITA